MEADHVWNEQLLPIIWQVVRPHKKLVYSHAINRDYGQKLSMKIMSLRLYFPFHWVLEQLF